MQHAIGIIGQAAHHILQSAANGAQHATDSQHAARVAAARAAHAAALAQKKVKAEAEEAEGADDLVAGAAVSDKAFVSFVLHLTIAAASGSVTMRHELLIWSLMDLLLFL